MSWQDTLEQASFRGVKFFVKSHTFTVGRRLSTHEFPFGELSFTEDLGKKTRNFNLEGFLIGKDYIKNRGEILSACEKTGVGVLVHHYLGRMNVYCKSLSVSEASENGGMATLSFQFVESGNSLVSKKDLIKNPSNVEFNVLEVEIETADTTQLKTLSNFEKLYTILNQASSAIQKAKDAIKQQLDDIKNAQKVCSDIAQTMNGVTELIKNVSSGIDKIVTSPQKIAGMLELTLGQLSLTIDKALSKNDPKRLAAAASFISPISGSLASPNTLPAQNALKKNTPSEDAKRIEAWRYLSTKKIMQPQILNSPSKEFLLEKRNKDILELTRNTLATTYLANAVCTSQYSSLQDAQNARDLVLSIADELLEHPLISDDMFLSLQNLQTSVHGAILSIENNLPIVRSFYIKSHTNLLSFLYENFESLEKEEDVLLRNKIKDPLNIQPGTVLQVAV